MKSKIILSWLVAILGLGSSVILSGCSEDSHLMEKEMEGEGFLQLYIEYAGNMTRASEEMGTKGESTISGIEIYLADNEGNIIKVNEKILLKETSDGYISTPVSVEAGNYLLYVVANPVHSDGTSFAPSLLDVDSFRGEYSLDKEKPELFMEDCYMVMANWNSGVNVNKGGIPVSVTESNTENSPVKAAISLDRLAAKIIPEVSESFTSTVDVPLISEQGSFRVNGSVIEAVGLLNGVSDFNLIQQWTKERDGNLLVTPSSSKGNYPLTRYYNTITSYVEAGAVKDKAPFIPLNVVEAESGNVRTAFPIYCMENNSPLYEGDEVTKYKGRTTAVIFRVKSVVNSEDGIMENHTYYKYNTLYFATLKDLNINNPELQLTGKESSAELRNKGIHVYENGYMYYTHWIRDNHYPEYIYSIARNTQYTLTVANLSGIGDDVPGGREYDPEDPIDVSMREIATTGVTSWSGYLTEHVFE